MKSFLFLLIASFSVIAMRAQSTSGQVRGSVKDASGKSWPSATVSLVRAKDSALVKIMVSNSGGQFAFDQVQPGKYLVRVDATGMSRVYAPLFEISLQHPDVTIETITLQPKIKDLNAVTVTAARPLVEQKIDRMVINVEAAVTNAGLNALDVLEKSPGIQVDKDGNISLKGKEGVMILIDGRPSYLSGGDLANLLRNMNANQLDQIEIMTNAPAKYDASGNAGVINIKTKKNKQFGYNGSVSLQQTQGKFPKTSESFNFNYRKNKVNLFTSLGQNYNSGYGQLDIQRHFRDQSTKQLLSNFMQEATMRSESRGYNAKLGADYFVNRKTTLGIVMNGYFNSQDQWTGNSTLISDELSHPVSETRAYTRGDQQWKNLSSNFNFRRLLDTAGKELTADADYIHYTQRNRTSLMNYYYDANQDPTARPDTLYGSLPQSISIYSGKMDYLQPTKNGGRIEAGIKSSIVRTDNDAVYDSIINGQYRRDVNRSNHFVYEENINAAYVSVNQPLNKKWGSQVGLRVENTNAKGNQVTTGIEFNRHYTQLFPTAYLQYTMDKKNTWTLNYGRRIRRPDYQALNPFIYFIDKYTYSQGNPDLKPQFSHNFELIHAFKSMVITTINYTRTTDIIQSVLEQNEAKNETYMKRSNIANQQQLGISVSTQTQIAKWWKSNIYLNVYNNKFSGLVNNEKVTVNATTLNANGSQQFTISKTLTAEINGFYRSGAVEGVIFARPMGAVSMGLTRQIWKNNGTLRLNVRDIFYTQGFRGVSKYSNIDASFQERRDSRTVTLGLSYRFTKGKVGNVKRRAGSASDEQSRIGN